MSRRWFCTPLERREVRSQRCDVESQRRDVGCFTLWNVATLHSHIATLPLFKAQIQFLLLSPLPSLPEPYCTPLSSAAHTPPHLSEFTPSPVGGHYFSLRPPHRHCHHHSLIPPPLSLSLSRAFHTTHWCPCLV